MNEANSKNGASGPLKGCLIEIVKAAREYTSLPYWERFPAWLCSGRNCSRNPWQNRNSRSFSPFREPLGGVCLKQMP